MNNTAELLTDTDILGDLPEMIRIKPAASKRVTAEEYVIQLQELEQVKIIPPVSRPVQVYVRQATPKRVPRAWWGWIVEPKKYRAKLHRWLAVEDNRTCLKYTLEAVVLAVMGLVMYIVLVVVGG